ncbi:uncharacterized protein LOC114266531 [Camellia sinensis]|uniref:uncharacterized protein LOC114266531 n=1 Tax=Camellia sinensis TaxID=4442 RepID=UPI0010364BF5|nr:uncharacterized protein LOC114266531 [Camellia sinensis]
MHTAFSMKELGNLSYFLGISVQSTTAGYFLSQQKYAKDILLKAGLSACKPCSSPIFVKPSTPPNASLPFDNPALYRSLVGALQYLTITRPDLSLAVNQACQHMHAPTVGHFAAVKRILRFVQGTLPHGLHYTPSTFDLHGFSDANWAGDIHDRKSISGYCVFLGNNLVSWSAKKQATASRSSTEAEYRALAHTAAELSWLTMLLTEMGISSSTTPVLWCDNLPAMALASNPVFHSRSKHIDIDCHFVREKILAKQFVVQYIPTVDQLADLFTKPLSVSRFQYLKDKLMVFEPPISLQGTVEPTESIQPQSIQPQLHMHTPSAQTTLQPQAKQKQPLLK